VKPGCHASLQIVEEEAVSARGIEMQEFDSETQSSIAYATEVVQQAVDDAAEQKVQAMCTSASRSTQQHLQ
jgi:hypothetical protein